MERLIRRAWWGMLAAALLVAGCHKQTPPVDTAAAPEGRPAVEPVAPPREMIAEEAVRGVLAGLRDDQPDAVWQALPASYQRDANDLLHHFADAMDADVWRRSFATLGKVVGVLRDKKGLVLAHPLVVQLAGDNLERVKTDYDLTINLLGTLVHSDLADRERLRTADMGDLLRTTGRTLMQQAGTFSRLTPGDPFQRGFKKTLADMRVATVEQSGDMATLRITWPGARRGEPVPFVRIEGKWLPRSLADGWKPAVTDLGDSLQNTAEMTRANRERILAQLDRLDGVLDQLQSAETQEQFNQAVAEQIVAPLRAILQGIPAAVAPSPDPLPPGGDSVVVIFDRELDAAEEEALQLNFSPLTDDGQGLAIPHIEKGTTRYDIAPVRDVAAFARRIDFAEVIAIDPAARTIRVRLPRQ